MTLSTRDQLQNELFSETEGKLIFRYDSETVIIEPWGRGVRVRATHSCELPQGDWALSEPVSHEGVIEIGGESSSVISGKTKVVIDNAGKLSVYNTDGKMLMNEYLRNRVDVTKEYCSALDIQAREFRPISGGDYALTVRFESLFRHEKIFGMGQYQQEILDLKGSELELAQRNSQASVPFCLSSEGYGFLWNNPAVGKAVFGTNVMSFSAVSTKFMDYWVVAEDTPAAIEEAYAEVSGKVPMMPDFAMGFWQCKLRYQTQEELLSIAREYKKRGLPISVIVIDFFHWPLQGEWKFDPVYWPDPDAMIRELQEMGIELMVSIWPTVDRRSENYQEMVRKGYLIRADRGVRISMTFQGNTVHYDATNPGARAYVWDKAKKHYYDKGIRIFWLDEAEPEYEMYDFDNYRYYLGPDVQVGNIYPLMYAKTFFDGMKAEGQENIINLLRCAWAGSQKYGALVWSGDIHSSFVSLRRQLAAGLNMAIAGIPWWTTDIGGFHGGDPESDDFRELIARWFQFGTFCPVMRLHGNREPEQPQVGTTGGATCRSGAANEVWSFGERNYEICKTYLAMRENLKPYITELMKAAHEKGSPVIRPLFYDHPGDAAAWNVEDQFMFGPSVLVAPVLYADQREREVYLPEGKKWKNYWTGEVLEGGKKIAVSAPIEQIPLFLDASCTLSF